VSEIDASDLDAASRASRLTAAQMMRMSRLLEEALALDEAGRREWLAALGPEQQDIAEALRGALSPDRTRTEEALATLPKVGADDEADLNSASGLNPGARVGPYELIRPLGAGGMAEVWLARRADGAIKREVALKLPQLLHWREDLAQRFSRERDILASLEHAHIARLYDVGSDPHGRPYFAMEYVQGSPLTDWCDAHRLGIPERLKLFLQILDAVEYAHQRHVIHRDLKPSNILVTDAGQARLLDFGIAKLLEEEAAQTALTSKHGRALTPDYASPEMLCGDPIDPHSDVYSLGVILYELLSGARPYRLNSARSIGMLHQAIGTVEIEKPSTRIEAQASSARATAVEKLRRLLRGDLDLISLKALAKDPNERYASAAEMSEDLQRYLDGKPVQARPAWISYRAGKWLQRNRTVVAVAAVAITAVLAAIGYELHRSIWNQAANTAAPVFAPPPHSIAVLPFVNLSGDAKQEYFSDGITEELLNAISRLSDLQVMARTSSFSFKGQNMDIATIAQKLNVGAILEGSVRRNADTVRITVQLINAVNGFHLWSQTYDRKLTDILKVQTDVATSVAQQLEVKLLADTVSKIEVGGTNNPEAYDAYLRGMQLLFSGGSLKEFAYRAPLAAFDRAIALDPQYARAYIGRAATLTDISQYSITPGIRARARPQALEAAERAVALAPQLGEAHLELARTRAIAMMDLSGAAPEYDRAVALSPGSARVWQNVSYFHRGLGHDEASINAARRALTLDPMNIESYYALASALSTARHYQEALRTYNDARALRPGTQYIEGGIVDTLLASGEVEQARQHCESLSSKLEEEDRQACLALAYHALGRQGDAERELETLKSLDGDGNSIGYAQIYA
jgi:eukaryotic-like serine/threonine-protein kinase